MRKLLAFCLCATFVAGDVATDYLQASAAATARDERAEAVLRQAREAIGGEAAINAVQNLLINGAVNHKMILPGGEEHTAQGNLEMALDLSGKINKRIQIGVNAPGAQHEANKTVIVKRADVLVDRNRENSSVERFEKRLPGGNADELSRLVFGFLLKTSPSLNAVYNYLGESSVDGTTAEIVEARSENGFAVKIFIDKQSHLPLMMSYRAVAPHQFVIIRKAGEPAPNPNIEKDVVILRGDVQPADKAAGDRQTKIFIRKKDADGNVAEIVKPGATTERVPLEEAEFQLRFSDYRSVDGLMLPHKIVQTVNGREGESITINNFQINAPNIAEKLKDDAAIMRKPKSN